jgi:hypothetical protein
MIITAEQREAMLTAAKPLIQWLAENAHPHCKAVVTQTEVELLSGVATHRTEEFLRDVPAAPSSASERRASIRDEVDEMMRGPKPDAPKASKPA